MDFDPKKILKQYWGFDEFRPSQLEIVASALMGKDTLALLPTGGGKSICFQVPALCKPGICLVITPLIALMKDQVANLKRLGIKALSIDSGMSKREIDYALDNAVYGDYKFLYISPERLKTPLFLARLEKMKVNLIAVDEAHCISQWGYDFRPAYLEINNLKELLPNIPVLALTATATPQVVEDIQDKLCFPKKNVIKKSFYRENLRYFVYNDERKTDILLSILKKQTGSGIVYVRSRNLTVEYANLLRNNGISSDFYHAGLSIQEREKKQTAWMQNKFNVICTTNAFGMGIDKPDVRFVVNVDLPESLEAYFQEAGRGGRDGKKAFAVLLANEGDKENLLKRTEQRFPEMDLIKRVYGFVCNELRLAIGAGESETFKTDWEVLQNKGSFSLSELNHACAFLERAGYWQISENARSKSVVKILVNQNQLYPIQVRYPLYDQVLKVLLRSHAGLFDNYVPIRESEIAKRSNLSVKKVIEVLNELTKLDLLDYDENQNKLAITFLQPRADIKNLRIPIEFYKSLKETAMNNTHQMIKYAYSSHLCRSRMLLKYFGEESEKDCGTCDYCISKKDTEVINNDLMQELKIKVSALLIDSPELTIRSIVDKLSKEFKRDNVKFAVQWMLDNGIIMVNQSSQI